MAVDLRSVRLGQGIEVSKRVEKGEEVWCVSVPSWLPAGWLTHTRFASLDEALERMESSGLLDAISALWDARMVQQRAQQKYLSIALDVYGKSKRGE